MKNELAFGRCERGVLDPGGDVFDTSASLRGMSVRIPMPLTSERRVILHVGIASVWPPITHL